MTAPYPDHGDLVKSARRHANRTEVLMPDPRLSLGRPPSVASHIHDKPLGRRRKVTAMTSWQIPGVPPFPGMADLVRLTQAQAEVIAELPETIKDLNRAVRSLAETVAATKETAAAAQRVSQRVEELLGEIETPIRELRPGLERLAQLLDDPAVDRIPAALDAIERTVVPVAETADRARARISRLRRLPAKVAERARNSLPRTRHSGHSR